MKIYIFADQEGVAGVFDRNERYLNATEYGTMELVALCEALQANGVDEILLNTIHIVEYEKLPALVRILHGLPRHDMFTEGLDGSFDASLIVGMHAMAGGVEQGCWRHTMLPHPVSQAYSALEAVWLNDRPVGETGLHAFMAGIHGVPVIYLSGDHWACLEARELIPGIETLAVKQGTSYFSAISMTPHAAATASAEAAVQSLRKIGGIAPLVIDGPVTMTVRYLFPERATDAVAAMRDARRIDERTVAVTYRDMAELRDRQGSIRAPELPVFAEDARQSQTTGFFTRYGPEPYQSRHTYPVENIR